MPSFKLLILPLILTLSAMNLVDGSTLPDVSRSSLTSVSTQACLSSSELAALGIGTNLNLNAVGGGNSQLIGLGQQAATSDPRNFWFLELVDSFDSHLSLVSSVFTLVNDALIPINLFAEGDKPPPVQPGPDQPLEFVDECLCPEFCCPPTFSGFCAQSNPQPSSVFPVLAVNGNTDVWALCTPNENDILLGLSQFSPALIFSPTPTVHPNCTSVLIEIVPSTTNVQ